MNLPEKNNLDLAITNRDDAIARGMRPLRMRPLSPVPVVEQLPIGVWQRVDDILCPRLDLAGFGVDTVIDVDEENGSSSATT